MQAEAAHQKSNYKKLNKAFTQRKNSKEDTIVLAKYSDRDSSSRSESNHSSNENGKPSIAYDSNSADDDKISSSYIISKDKV